MTSAAFITEWIKNEKISPVKEEYLENIIQGSIPINSLIQGDCGVSEADFKPLKVLGRGAFGKVILMQKIDSKKLYAVKVLKKSDLIKKDMMDKIKTEKDILMSLNHPFIVNMNYCFTNPERIFFVMRFMRGGELFQHLQQKGRFSESEYVPS